MSKPDDYSNVTIVKSPLVIMFKNDDDSVTCHIHASDGYGYEAYGLLVCDPVHHIASAFKVDEDDVWEWVEKERHRPTTTIRQPS